MKEGRTFALTGPQMLEIVGLCEAAVKHFDRSHSPGTDRRDRAIYWAEYLRRQHAAHFGTEEEAEGS